MSLAAADRDRCRRADKDKSKKPKARKYAEGLARLIARSKRKRFTRTFEKACMALLARRRSRRMTGAAKRNKRRKRQ
jgi:hypothetical protein